MSRPARVLAPLAALALLASACGGTAVTPSPSAAPTSAAPTASPAPTKPVVPATGQGATTAKLGEAKMAVTDGVAPDLAAGSYIATVSVVTLEKGGRTVAHKHGGIEAIYVLQGSIDFRTAGGGRVLLNKGQGASVAPNTALQAVNSGDGVAKFIAFFMTAEAAPFSTNVDQAP